MIEFFVPGEPQPGGSKRSFIHPHTGRLIVTDDNPKAKPWKNEVAKHGRIAYKGEVLSGPILVSVQFSFLRPKSHFRSGKFSHLLKSSAPVHWHTQIPDASKCWRSTEDALTGIIWKDDAQLLHFVNKIWSDKEGARIRIWPIADSPDVGIYLSMTERELVSTNG